MKAILRRLACLEKKFFPPVDERSRRVVEIIRERYRRHMEASGQPFDELPPLPPLDYRGPRLGVAETLRLALTEAVGAGSRATSNNAAVEETDLR